MNPSEASQASSPETAPARLFELAGRYPSEVLANPSLALIALEDPDLGARIANTAKLALTDRELSAALQRLDAYDAAHFAVDCLERLRPYLGEPSERPRKHDPHRALEALRRRADARFDRAGKAALTAAKLRGERLISGPPEMPPPGRRLSVESANRALLEAIARIDGPDPASEAYRFSDGVVYALKRLDATAALEERRWQLERCSFYLRRPRRVSWRRLWAALYYKIRARRPWYSKRRLTPLRIALLVGAALAVALFLWLR
jgi:hypothetical protein